MKTILYHNIIGISFTILCYIFFRKYFIYPTYHYIYPLNIYMLAGYIGFIFIFLLISISDLFTMHVPVTFISSLALFGIVANVFLFKNLLLFSIQGLIVGFSLIFVLSLFYRLFLHGNFALGDMLAMAGIGSLLGTQAVFIITVLSLFFSFCVFIFIKIVLNVFKKQSSYLAIPLTPLFFISILVYIFYYLKLSL